MEPDGHIGGFMVRLHAVNPPKKWACLEMRNYTAMINPQGGSD